MTFSSPPARTAVRWGVPSGGVFLLDTDDVQVADRARVVFAPWAADDRAAATPIRSWRVHPTEAGHAWTISGGHTPAVTRTTPAHAVTAVEFQAVQALYDRRDRLVFHAALVSRGGRGLLVFGPCESGKTTLACALWSRGWSLHADDTAVVDPETGEARPAPRRVSLRTSSRALVGEALWSAAAGAPDAEPTADGLLFHPPDLDGARPAPVRLSAGVFLARRGAASAAGAVPLSPADVTLALLPYSNRVRHADPGAAIAEVSRLALAVPCYDLARGPLDVMATACARLCGAET